MNCFEEMYELDVDVSDDHTDFYLADPVFTFEWCQGPDPADYSYDIKSIQFFKETQVGDHTQMIKVIDPEQIKMLREKFLASREYEYALDAALERYCCS